MSPSRTAREEAEAAHPGRVVRLRASSTSRVCCDADRVSQLVSNLVSNALEHGAPDAHVEVTVAESEEDAILGVHNEGKAIPSELLPHVFEAFRRSRSGLGLGLCIARSIVVAHDGSIEAESESGKGTTIAVRLLKRGPAGSPAPGSLS